MRITTNVTSVHISDKLRTNQLDLSDRMSSLSTGKRIKSARDDAAGMSISGRLSSLTNGLKVAVRNANDGISMMRVADGALTNITNSLLRMRDIAIQSANATNTALDRESLNKEVIQLKNEITNINDNTSFGRHKLFDNNGYKMTFQVGAASQEVIDVRFNAFDLDTLDIKDLNVSTQADSQSAITAIDDAIQFVGGQQAQMGGTMNRFTSAINNLKNIDENISDSNGQLKDADYAKQTAELTRLQVTRQAATALLSQANSEATSAVSLLG